LRKVREAVEAGNFDEAQKMMPAASSSIDKAASKGVMHRNRAARLKSRLVLTLLKAKSAAA
jgi:small subunit ribosomal protein S20